VCRHCVSGSASRTQTQKRTAQEQWHTYPSVPPRCFNPASLTTCDGRSILGQLMKSASAIVIEDLDLMPDHLQTHRGQFGLAGTAAVHCIADGFVTEAQQYVVMSAEQADRIPGNRLW